MTETPQQEHRRTLAEALRDAVLAWSPRAYEARLVFTAVVAGFLARWLQLSALWSRGSRSLAQLGEVGRPTEGEP